jgi:hypothetical protein
MRDISEANLVTVQAPSRKRAVGRVLTGYAKKYSTIGRGVDDAIERAGGWAWIAESNSLCHANATAV